MGILDDLTSGLFDPFSGPSRIQKRGNRIQEEGAPATGVLRGIRVREHTESADDWFFAVDVQPVGVAPFRAACRQSVLPVRDSLRLGMPVEVRHDGEAIVLAWDPTGPGNWKPASGVDEGIDDPRLGKLRGNKADAELLGWRQASLFGVARVDRDVRVKVDGRELPRRAIFVPEWAGHLLAPGTTWPVFLKGDKFNVDWMAAVERHGYGVREPTPPPTDAAGEEAPAVESVLSTAATAPVVVPDAADPHGVSFDTWVAVSAGMVRDRVAPAAHDSYAGAHGVPAGRWAAAEAEWRSRMMSDWQLGARFGEAYQRALKGR